MPTHPHTTDVTFTNRVDAGRHLARRLERFRDSSAIVLGLPRGGVPVAAEVAEALSLPLDIIIVRKLGVPFQPEIAMGAIGEGGVRVIDRALMTYAGLTNAELKAVERREREELDVRVRRLRRGRQRHDLRDRTAIIVDDGLATGSTARVACAVARQLGAARVVLAVPVAPAEVLHEFVEADTVECVSTPADFLAVGQHYRDFSATSDNEVIVLLDRAAERETAQAARHGQAGVAHSDGSNGPSAPGFGAGPDADEDVRIPAGDVILNGHLHLPDGAEAVVAFAHGSGSSRFSPRNRFVASVLHDAGFGTLLLDLLTEEEEDVRANVFDIGLQTERLLAVTAWLGRRADTTSCRIGYFGASTGAGAALLAAASAGVTVGAVVSRGGRPDLAGAQLAEVTAPTLLIVGGADELVCEQNRQALAQLRGPAELVEVADATHLFDEPGALGEVALLARDWFARYLTRRHP